MKRTLDTLTRLPRHPFKLARALIRQPEPDTPPGSGPQSVDDLPDWVERFPIVIAHPHRQIATAFHAEFVRHKWRSLLCSSGDGARLLCLTTPVSLLIIGPGLPGIHANTLINELYLEPYARAIPVLALIMHPSDIPPHGAAWLEIPVGREPLIDQARTLLLTKGNWRLPLHYNQEFAERVLAVHVYAR